VRLFETRAAFRSGDTLKQDYIDAMYAQHRCLYEYAEFIRETDIARIEVTDGTVVMTSRSTGVKTYCDARDKRIPPLESLNFDFYERSEMDMMFRIIEPGFTVFDIGANIGWYSLNIAKTVPNVRIMAFEPLPETFGQLSRNIELNEVTNVQAYSFGFSNKEQELPFYFCPDSSGSASAANIGGRNDAKLVRCRVRRLDDFVAESGVVPDFIKCDVEGGELFVFQGGMESIRKHKPVILSEMLRKWSAKFNYSPNDVIDLLSSAGYRCYAIQDDRLARLQRMNESTVETNFFFLHVDKHKTKIDALVSDVASSRCG
jgi:FkbM family methyltransferase